MAIGKAFQVARHAYNSGHISATFTVTQEKHPLLGKDYEFRRFESIKIVTGAKSSALKSNGSWPVTHTPAMADDPKVTIGGVPSEERLDFIKFIGDGNGAANTIGTLSILAKLPGKDPDKIVLEGFQAEGIAEFSFEAEGSTEDLEGPYTIMKINDVDPLDQTF